MRPSAGAQAHFKQSKPAQEYRCDSSLPPSPEWDGQNSARERGENLLARIAALTVQLRKATSDQEQVALLAELERAAQDLGALGRPFFNWAGKAERLSLEAIREEFQ